MRFLIDACLPRELAAIASSYGHDALDVRDIGMRTAEDSEIAAYAKDNGLALLSEDWGFADIRRYPPRDYPGIVVFQTRDSGIDETIAAMRNLLDRPDVVQALRGRLAIVSATRLRLRPPM